MAGAIDLFSGAQSIHGSNVFKVDKSPLEQMSGGIDDIIGSQAQGAGGGLVTTFEGLLRAILGFDPLEGLAELGSDIFGTVANLGTYFGNLEAFLGELNPLDPHFNPIHAAIEFIQNILNPAGLGSLITGIIPQAITGIEEFILELIGGAAGLVASGVQSLIDAVIGGLSSTTLIGNPIEFVQPLLQQVALDIQGVGNAATTAFETVTQFGGILHQLVEGLTHNPVYESAEHFIESIESVVGQVWNNILTSLSPNNPTVQQNTAAITAILAHLSSSSVAGINYQFSTQVALSANYQNTSNPAWTAPTGFSLPSCTQTDVLLTPNITIGVFTGNPNNAVTGDHGVVTDRSHVQATIRSVELGDGEIFMHGHGTTGLAQNVALHYTVGLFGQLLQIVTYTGAIAGGQVRVSTPIALAANNTVALEYDPGTNAYTMYVNGAEVGVPWVDAQNEITHGAGYREVGVKINLLNQIFLPGPAFGSFIAYDF